MSNRGVKSRFKSNANASTTTNTISVNDDMTTTENDDITTKARRATSPMTGEGRPRPSPEAYSPYKDPQVGIEAGILPSGVPVPAHGLISMHAGERVRVRSTAGSGPEITVNPRVG
jgi:hypothetical protein